MSRFLAAIRLGLMRLARGRDDSPPPVTTPALPSPPERDVSRPSVTTLALPYPPGPMSKADEWLACSDPLRMLGKLGDQVSERKLRLFACAGCRRLWMLLRDPRSRTAVEVSERYADGLAGPEELAAAAAGARDAADEVERARTPGWNAALSAAMTAEGARAAAVRVAGMVAFDADLLRDVFGNPFRPIAVEPAWREWAGGTAIKLARAIYEERRFGDLPVLADALEEAGCTDEEILGHLRGPGPHVRGCHVLDALLGLR